MIEKVDLPFNTLAVGAVRVSCGKSVAYRQINNSLFDITGTGSEESAIIIEGNFGAIGRTGGQFKHIHIPAGHLT